MPASAVETVILPARVANYTPAMLDELTSAGEVVLGRRRSDRRVRRLGALVSSPTWSRAGPVPSRPATAARSCWPLWPAEARTSSTGCCPTRGARPIEPTTSPRCGIWSGRAWSRATPSPRSGCSPPAVRTGDPRGPRRAPHRSRPGVERPRLGRTPRLGRSSPTTAGRWSLVDRARHGGRAAGRGRLRPARPVRRRHPRQRADRELRRRLRRGVPGAERVGGVGPVPPGLLRRGARRGPVRAHRAVDRLRAQRASRRIRSRSCWRRATRPTRTGPRCPGPNGKVTVRAARPAPWSSWSTGHWCSTSSAVARRCCPSPRTTTGSGRRPRHLASSVPQGLLGKLTVERADGGHVFGSAQVSEALQEAGFRMTPQGLRLPPVRR